MHATDPRSLAHQALVIAPFPFLKYQRTGKYMLREGVAFTAQDMSGPSFNFVGAVGPAPGFAIVNGWAEEFYRDRPGGYGILVEADAGHPMEAELRQAGWVVVEDEPALVMPQLPPTPKAPPELQVEAVADESGRQAYLQIVGEAFGASPEIAEGFFRDLSLARDPEMAFLVGFRGGQPVSASFFHQAGATAIVSGVATIPGARGKGYGAALTWATIDEGRKRGCQSAALRSGPLSMPLYQRLGFVLACRHRTYAPQ